VSKPKVWVTRRIPERGLEKVLGFADAEVWEDELPPPREVILEKVRGRDGLLPLLTDRIDAAVMDAAGPQLRVISNYAVGFDNVSVPDATARGILVTNTPGVLTDTTADMAWALMMAAARRIVEGDRFVRAHRWKTWGPLLLLGQDLHHATLGILGFGRIGQAVAKRATGFSMRILWHDVVRTEPMEATARELGAEFVDLDTLYAESDFLSIHTQLTEETRGMINAAAFAKMKPTAIVINTARGPIIHPDDLYVALRDGQIGGAGLDVTDPEPIPPDSPLLTLDNLVLCPHIASASVATRTKMALMAAENLIAGLSGQRPPNLVNPEVLER
jgi:glyoxylate reductase